MMIVIVNFVRTSQGLHTNADAESSWRSKSRDGGHDRIQQFDK